MKKKSKVALYWFLGIVVVAAIILALYFGLKQEQQIGTGTYYNVPTFGYYQCGPAGSPETSGFSSISSTGSGFVTCPSPSTGCQVTVAVPTQTYNIISSAFTGYRVVTQICSNGNTGCQAQTITNLNTQIFSSGSGIYQGYYTMQPISLNPLSGTTPSSIWIDFQQNTLLSGWHDISGASYTVTYTPFILYKYNIWSSTNSQPITTPAEGCNLGYLDTSNLLQTISTNLQNTIGGTQTSSANNQLQPYQTRTFVTQFVPISVNNNGFETYNNQQAYCSGNMIYSLGTVTTSSGTYNIINLNSNSVLGTVTCCNGDSIPNAVCVNNQWQTTVQSSNGTTNIQCSAFNPCPESTPTEYNNTYLISQSCVNSMCVSSYSQVQCTNDAACGTGQICELSNHTCANVQGGVPGNVSGSGNQSNQTIICPFGQQQSSISTTVYKTSILGIFNFNPQTTTTPICVTADWIIVAEWGVIIIVLVIALALIFKKKTYKGRRR